MVAQINVSTNIAKVLKQLKKIHKDQIPFATSRAMEKTVLKAREEVYKKIPQSFDKPGKAFLKRGRAGRQGVRSGWIRADWPSKRDIQKQRRGEASVYIWGSPQDTAGAQSKGKNINEIMHRNVYGGRVDTVSLNTPLVLFGRKMVIEPTGYLLNNPREDELIRINKAGNIMVLRKRLTQVKNHKDGYLVVRPIQRNVNKKLTPGIYKKIYAEYRYKQRPRTPRGKLQRAVKLVKLLHFKDMRTHKARFDFPAIVNKSYNKEFRKIFRKEYAIAVATAKVK